MCACKACVAVESLLRYNARLRTGLIRRFPYEAVNQKK